MHLHEQMSGPVPTTYLLLLLHLLLLATHQSLVSHTMRCEPLKHGKKWAQGSRAADLRSFHQFKKIMSESPRENRKKKRSKSHKKDKGPKDSLSQGRLALQALRALLGFNYDLRDELKQLVRSLDDGKSLDIDGIPDAYVKDQIAFIFKNCSLLRRKDKYTYQSRDKPGRGTVLALLEPVMDEPREDLEKAYEAYRVTLKINEKKEKQVDMADDLVKVNAKVRKVGPSLPTAAERIRAMQVAQDDGRDEEDAHENVGPSLPEFVFEELEASTDPKIAAVGRVMRVIEEHRAKDVRGKDAKAYLPDPYAVLNLDTRDVSDSQVKKAFMKLSLLLHPDKNDHGCAATAFDAVSVAAKRLQDASGRLVVRKELGEMREVEVMKGLVAQEAKRRAWAHATGKDVGVAAEKGLKGPPVREAWMTTLPEKGDPLANIDIGVSRQFSTRQPNAPRMTKAERGVRAERPAVVQSRGPSLMEQHAERIKEATAATGLAAQQEGARRPFDRERDLELKKRGGSAAELLQGMPNLDSRFGRGSS